jgi:hypothetical protein
MPPWKVDLNVIHGQSTGATLMLTGIFLTLVGIFAIAGTFISIEQKRRADERRERLTFPRESRQRLRRVTRKND